MGLLANKNHRRIKGLFESKCISCQKRQFLSSKAKNPGCYKPLIYHGKARKNKYDLQ
jgi:hypothetical protein